MWIYKVFVFIKSRFKVRDCTAACDFETTVDINCPVEFAVCAAADDFKIFNLEIKSISAVISVVECEIDHIFTGFHFANWKYYAKDIIIDTCCMPFNIVIRHIAAYCCNEASVLILKHCAVFVTEHNKQFFAREYYAFKISAWFFNVNCCVCCIKHTIINQWCIRIVKTDNFYTFIYIESSIVELCFCTVEVDCFKVFCTAECPRHINLFNTCIYIQFFKITSLECKLCNMFCASWNCIFCSASAFRIPFDNFVTIIVCGEENTVFCVIFCIVAEYGNFCNLFCKYFCVTVN